MLMKSELICDKPRHSSLLRTYLPAPMCRVLQSENVCRMILVSGPHWRASVIFYVQNKVFFPVAQFLVIRCACQCQFCSVIITHFYLPCTFLYFWHRRRKTSWLTVNVCNISNGAGLNWPWCFGVYFRGEHKTCRDEPPGSYNSYHQTLWLILLKAQTE